MALLQNSQDAYIGIIMDFSEGFDSNIMLENPKV